MRQQLLSFILALAATPTIIAQAHGEDFWIKSSSTPVLTVSDDPARFDPGYVVEPRIVYDDDTNTYFMFYTGATVDDRPNRESIGLATAPSLRVLGPSTTPQTIGKPFSRPGKRATTITTGIGGKARF